ncbi:Cytochrome c551 peroxidase precursor [compost metagenome]
MTGRLEDLGAFKTPTLRNVADTAPYFHIGSARTLEEAVLHYERNLEDFTDIDPEVEEPIFLPGNDRADLVEFLKALLGPDPHR